MGMETLPGRFRQTVGWSRGLSPVDSISLWIVSDRTQATGCEAVGAKDSWFDFSGKGLICLVSGCIGRLSNAVFPWWYVLSMRR